MNVLDLIGKLKSFPPIATVAVPVLSPDGKSTLTTAFVIKNALLLSSGTEPYIEAFAPSPFITSEGVGNLSVGIIMEEA